MNTASSIAHITAALVGVVCAASAGAQQRAARGTTAVQPPPAPTPRFSMPTPASWELPNGLRLLVVEDMRAPVFEARVVVRSGWIDEPRESAGISRLVRDMVRSGAADMWHEVPTRALNSLGLTFDAGVSPTDEAGLTTTLRVTGPSPQLASGIALLGRVAQPPTFRPEVVATRREALAGQLRRQQLEPRLAAQSRVLARLAGPVLAGRAAPTEDALRALEAEEIARFHQVHYQPGNVTLVVVAPVVAESVRRMVAVQLGAWERDAERPARPAVERLRETTFDGVPRPEAAHSAVAIAMTVGGASAADHAMLLLLRMLLARRLAGVAEVLAMRQGVSGLLLLRAVVVPDEAGRVVGEMQSQLARVAEAPPDADELESLVAQLTTARLAATESQAGLAEALATAQALDADVGYWREFSASLERMSVADVQRAARRDLRPNAIAVVAVGSDSVIRSASAALVRPPDRPRMR